MMALEIFKICNLLFEIVKVVTSNTCHKEGQNSGVEICAKL